MLDSARSLHFLRHIELYLTAVGLLVIALMPNLFAPERRATATALTALAVGVVHGLLFWLVRRRQRMVREALLRDIQRMLMDRINNKLQVVLVHASASAADQLGDDQQQLEEVVASVNEVKALLTRLSLESLSAWQERYALKPTGP